ncbi:Glycosyl transferase group 1 [uncultured Alphaproteobacteria bacterium]|uniref:Glycosyl transferase group 1 n=1 Tax=uncultured Alphaproteobacteria bacterium TaxID=91750 RepID=A0A212KIB9_9PROT|nr:Glycosyl transferase group 1 [uncultured Alphaproteobacteria bacterium]
MSGTPDPRRLAIFMPSLTGGGAERMLLQVAAGIAERGYAVDLLLSRVKGDHDARIPPGLAPVRLAKSSDLRGRALAAVAAGAAWPGLLKPVLLPVKSSWALRYLPALTDYLRERRPHAMLAANSWPNLVALWAQRLAAVETRIVVSERVHLSERVTQLRRKWRWRHLPDLLHAWYPQAAAVIAVSQGVADDLTRAADLRPGSVEAVRNPVVTPGLLAQAAEPNPDPWFAAGAPPVVLGVGRLHPQKDFPTLLRAFAQARAVRPLRLLILGEGAERAALERLAADLGVADDVRLPGFVANPFSYMARAAVFALSSVYEGLPGVLIQAIACGCPAVSTDCPSGPAEILEGLGPLVPVGDAPALAAAILRTLDAPPDRAQLRCRGLDFAADPAIERYLSIMLGRA